MCSGGYTGHEPDDKQPLTVEEKLVTVAMVVLGILLTVFAVTQ